MTATTVTDVITTALPYLFLIGSALLIARLLRPEWRRSPWTLVVIVLAVAVGVFWGYLLVGLAAISGGISPRDAGMAMAGAILLTIAGSLDVLAIASRATHSRLAPVVAAVIVGAMTAPALVLGSYEIDSAGQKADASAAEADQERAISDRSAPLSIVVHEAAVTLAGPIPTFGPGAPGVDATVRLRMDLVSTSEIPVGPGGRWITIEVTKPGAIQSLAGFSLDPLELPPVIPVGATPLDLDLEGGVTAGSDLESASAVWTVSVTVDYSRPGTGYRVETGFQPTFAP